PCAACTDGCCETGEFSRTWEFLHAGTCPDGKMACSVDGDCLATGTCVANCCEPIVLDFCPDTPKCTVDSDCSGDEEICQWGCCAGRCGLGGTICDEVDTLTCSERKSCGAGETCEHGCCVL